MFERFTDRARRVVVLSQEEARRLGHNYIGTEHLLLGLVHEGEGVAARALVSLGISLDETRRRVEEIIGRGEGKVPGHIPFTPRAKAVLELSLREALGLGHNYIGTEHILLGLIREGEGVAAQVLVTLGAPLPVVRARVVDLLAGVAPATDATGPVVGGTRVMARLAARSPAGAGARGDEMLERSIDRIVFRRFTVSSSRALMLAESEAMRLGHPLVGVADLLLGLTLEGEGGAARALGGVGVDLDRARTAAEQVLGAGRGSRGSVDGYDDDLLDAIERALVEAVVAGVGRASDDDSAQAGDAGDAGDAGRGAGGAGDEAGPADDGAGGEAGRAGGEAGHAGGGAGDAAVDGEAGGAVGRGAGEGHEPDRPAARPDRPAAPAPPDEQIDTEELLLGLVAQAERRSGVAAQMLTALGTTPAAVRRAVGDLPGRAPAEQGDHPPDQGVPSADAGNESGAGPGVESSGP